MKLTLLGTTHNNVRVMRRGNLAKLRTIAKTLKHSAIYREFVGGNKFHNATAKAFLVEHYHDPYWIAQGVPSTPE